jgi:hypothetical protein
MKGSVMNIKVEEVIENEDGSATLQLDLDNEALSSLLEIAVVTALREAIGRNQPLLGNPSQMELEL